MSISIGIYNLQILNLLSFIPKKKKENKKANYLNELIFCFFAGYLNELITKIIEVIVHGLI